MVTEGAIRNWHREAETYISKIHGCQSIFNEPQRHFNADETGFAFEAGTGRITTVIVARGSRYVPQRSAGTKAQITAMMCCSASGDFLPLFIVVAGKRPTIPPTQLDMAAYPEAAYVTSAQGWQTSDTFLDFLKVFRSWVIQLGCTFPVVLWLDGHRSHISEESARWAREQDIILYLFLPNSTNLLQPFDVGVAASLKAAWTRAVHSFQLRGNNEMVTKKNFPGVLKEAVATACTKETAITGFRKCGIQPWDINAVQFEKLVTHVPKASTSTNTDSRQSTGASATAETCGAAHEPPPQGSGRAYVHYH